MKDSSSSAEYTCTALLKGSKMSCKKMSPNVCPISSSQLNGLVQKKVLDFQDEIDDNKMELNKLLSELKEFMGDRPVSTKIQIMQLIGNTAF